MQNLKLFLNPDISVPNPAAFSELWWNITTHFGHRARDEARQLQLGDIQIDTDPTTGEEFLIWDTERSTKTRTGERPMGSERLFNPKAYATGNKNCPVAIFREFISRRPDDMMDDNSPLFLQCKWTHVVGNIDGSIKTWYYNRPLGKNSIGKFLSEAVKNKLLPKGKSSKSKVANHSARKTSLSKLLSENVHPIIVKQLSGHKKAESLNNYSGANNKQQLNMSKILTSSNHDNSNISGSVIPSSSASEIPLQIQQQLLQSWNPMLPPIFNGAQISNCTFNIYNNSTNSKDA